MTITGEQLAEPEIPTVPTEVDEALHLLFNAGVALFGHGAESEDVQGIMRHGLWVKLPSLLHTSNLLMNPAKDQTNVLFNSFTGQKRRVDQLFSDWPGNRYTSDFRDIVLVGIQTASNKDRFKWDAILPENPEPQEKWDQPYTYVVPPRYIPGFVNIDDRIFYPNMHHTFDPSLVADLPDNSGRWVIPDQPAL
jgi:hypothetical protein